MSTYNILQAEIACPRCKTSSCQEVELHFGNTHEMRRVQLNETYPWSSSPSLAKGGRPGSGVVEGLGYCECSSCRRDFFIWVLISESNIVQAVSVAYDRLPYKADLEITLPAGMVWPGGKQTGDTEIRLRFFEGYSNVELSSDRDSKYCKLSTSFRRTIENIEILEAFAPDVVNVRELQK